MTSTMSGHRERLGFRDGDKGVHSSRTLMLGELGLVLAATGPDAGIADFRRVVCEDNVLGKRTATTREHTVRKLKALYALDPTVPVYRLMRHFWEADPDARPGLALLCAVARDPLLRASVDTILDLPLGTELDPAALEATVRPSFSPSTRAAIASHLTSSWVMAGYLSRGTTKVRTQAVATAAATAYALALGFMEGGRGRLLLSTPWTRLLDHPEDAVVQLVQQAARRGWVEYRAAGDVVDLRVEALFTETERGWCDGQPG
jgi:hypothetical protein